MYQLQRSALSNPALFADSYKLSHKAMEPEGTEIIYSNFTPRFNKYFKELYPNHDGKTVVFGIYPFLLDFLVDYWEKGFFKRPKEDVLQEIRETCYPYVGMDTSDLKHFEELHDLGYLPLRVKALPEGSTVNTNIPVLTVVNTHKNFSWLTNYIESVLSSELWKPMTVATVAREFDKLVRHWFDKTVSDQTFRHFAIHDFSYRGHGTHRESAMCGAAPLLFSNGTDNIPGILVARSLYNAPEDVAGSVAASEHSVTTLGINFFADQKFDGELKTLADQLLNKMIALGIQSEYEKALGELVTIYRLLTEVYPTGIFSYVSDSYDYWRVLTLILPILKPVILRREGKLVIRPDCYSSDTQTLTKSGWKLFKDLSPTDQVAQVLDDGSYEFVTPLKIVNVPYKGKMFLFKDHHGKVDQLVTPDHRMLYKQIHPDGSVSEVIKFAKDMKNSGNHLNYFERSAKSINRYKTLTSLERLNIAFQADGSFIRGCNTRVRFSFSKKRKIGRLISILNSTGLPYKVYQLAGNKVEFNVEVSATLLSKTFDWVDTSNLCSNWSSEFIEELKYWDSSIRSNGRFKYDTTTYTCSTVVELIAIAAGKGIYTSYSSDARQAHFSDVYTSHIMDSNKAGGQSWTKEEVDYDGTVHCVQVPTGRLIVKRNKSIMVCGNSGDPVNITSGHTVTELLEYPDFDSFATSPSFRQKFDVIKLKDTYYRDDSELDTNGEFIKKYAVVTEEEVKGSIQVLSEVFGFTTNTKGYKELPPQIGLIYGDGITYARGSAIYSQLADKGFASNNVVLGVGSFSFSSSLSRDSLGFAVKATYAEINGNPTPIYKEPKTDLSKKSARGLMKIVEDDKGELVLVDQVSWAEEAEGLLQVVFENGKLFNQPDFTDIRTRLGFSE